MDSLSMRWSAVRGGSGEVQAELGQEAGERDGDWVQG